MTTTRPVPRRYSRLAVAAGQLLEDGFAALIAEGVIPRSRHEPWIHVGQHHDGSTIHRLPARSHFSGALVAAFPDRFRREVGGFQWDHAELYADPLISAAVARLTIEGHPYDHRDPISQELVTELVEYLRSGREPATVARLDTVFLKRLYVLFFIHVGSRRIVWAASTGEPKGEWVTQQARNTLWQLAEEATEVRLVLHDRDRKFSRGFDTVWEAEGARVMLTPLMAPKANAYAERWVGSARRECLDWMLIVGQRHLSRVVNEYVTHYNTERPHRSRDLMPPAGTEPSGRYGRIVSRPRLGGLTHEYSRQMEAA